MNEPWFSPAMLSILNVIFDAFGTLVVINAVLGVVFIIKGKAKKLVLGVNTLAFALGFIFLVVGIIAYMSGQPRGVWWEFIYTGCLGLLIFGSFIYLTLKMYRPIELRKSMSEDLTFGGDKDNQHKHEQSTEPLELLSTTETQEVSKSVLLKEIFHKLDRLLSEYKEFKKDLKRFSPKYFGEYDVRGKALEDEIQGYCQRIAKEFPGAVTFITFQGREWAYDVDFQVIQDSLEEPVLSELEGYFRYTSLRKMFRLFRIPSILLKLMQPIRR